MHTILLGKEGFPCHTHTQIKPSWYFGLGQDPRIVWEMALPACRRSRFPICLMALFLFPLSGAGISSLCLSEEVWTQGRLLSCGIPREFGGKEKVPGFKGLCFPLGIGVMEDLLSSHQERTQLSTNKLIQPNSCAWDGREGLFGMGGDGRRNSLPSQATS